MSGDTEFWARGRAFSRSSNCWTWIDTRDDVTASIGCARQKPGERKLRRGTILGRGMRLQLGEQVVEPADAVTYGCDDLGVRMTAVSGKCGATIETNNTQGRASRRVPVLRSQIWAAAATCRSYKV